MYRIDIYIYTSNLTIVPRESLSTGQVKSESDWWNGSTPVVLRKRVRSGCLLGSRTRTLCHQACAGREDLFFLSLSLLFLTSLN